MSIELRLQANNGKARGGSTPSNITSKKLCQKTIILFIYFYLFVLFCDCNVRKSKACNTPLEWCFQDLFNGILQALEFLIFQLVKPKKECSHLATAEHDGQRTAMGKRLQFFSIMSSTSALKESWAINYYWRCLLVVIEWSI
jgi:hypothetical protein